MNTIDVPRLRKALEHVTAQPQSWRQAYWVTVSDKHALAGLAGTATAAEMDAAGCGTAYCLAGTVVAQHGAAFGLNDGFGATGELSQAISAETGVKVHVGTYAAELLGIDDAVADTLFRATNSLAWMWALASALTDGEIELPPPDAFGHPSLYSRSDFDDGDEPIYTRERLLASATVVAADLRRKHQI